MYVIVIFFNCTVHMHGLYVSKLIINNSLIIDNSNWDF